METSSHIILILSYIPLLLLINPVLLIINTVFINNPILFKYKIYSCPGFSYCTHQQDRQEYMSQSPH